MRRRKGIEKRLHPRFNHKQAAVVVAGELEAAGETKDISLTGLFVSVSGLLIEANSVVKVRVRVGSAGGELELTANVVRVIKDESDQVSGVALLLSHTPATRNIWSQHIDLIRRLHPDSLQAAWTGN